MNDKVKATTPDGQVSSDSETWGWTAGQVEKRATAPRVVCFSEDRRLTQERGRYWTSAIPSVRNRNSLRAVLYSAMACWTSRGKRSAMRSIDGCCGAKTSC